MAQLKNDTEPPDIEEVLNDLGHRLDRVKQLYEMYFLGIERTEPQVARKEIQRAMVGLQQLNIRNTGLRFKFNALNQKWNTYQQYWGRTIREIENGTYVRHIQRLKRQAERDGKELPPEIVRLREKIAAQFGSQAVTGRAATEKPADPAAAPAPVAVPVAAPPPPKPLAKIADAFSEFSDMRAFLDDDTDSFPRVEPATPPPELPRPAFKEVKTNIGMPPPTRPPATTPPAFKPVVTAIGQAPPPRPAPPPTPGAARPPAPPPPTPTAAATAKPGMPPPPPAPRAPIPPPKPAPVAAAPAPKPAPVTIPGMNDGELRDLHQRYVAARKSTGEAANVSYDSLVSSISKQVPRLMEQPGVKKVKFEVVTQNGKTVLKAIPQK